MWWGAGLRHQIDESFKPGRVFTTFDFMLVAGEYGVPGLCRTSRLIASTGVHTRGTPHKRYMISTYPALYCCLRFHRVSSTHSYSSVSVYGMLPILHHPLGEDVETFSLRQSSASANLGTCVLVRFQAPKSITRQLQQLRLAGLFAARFWRQRLHGGLASSGL